MVIVDTSFNRLQGRIKQKITLEEIRHVLDDMGMELAEAEGDEIKIEITADRVDLITPEGIARAINSYCGFVKGYEKVKINAGDYVHKVDATVKKYRPYTRSFVVKKLKFSEDDIKFIMSVQEKIHDTYGRKRKKVAIGLYNLNKITFPVIYCAKKPEDIKFVPLGMDYELNGRQILQRHPTGRDYAHLLEDFDKFPLQIDSKGRVLSMPPIINSNYSGKMDTETKDIFVECTGPDEESLDNTMNILAAMFADWGGEVYSVTIEDGNSSFLCPAMKETKKEISVDYANRLIGFKIKPNEAVKCLEKMGYNVDAVNGDKITVSIPSVRTDIWHQVDIADDIARGFGYNRIALTLPNISTIGKMLPENIIIEDLRNFLVGFGLIELKTFALTNNINQYKMMNIEEEEHISLGKNTQDKSLNMIRSWLIPEVIKALVANRNKEYPQNVFEVGTVIVPDKKTDVRARNVNKLVCLLCEEKADFTKIKQILTAVMDFLGLEYEIKESEHGSFISGRMGEIYTGEKKLGIIGEISPQVITNWALAVPIVAFELDLEELFKLIK